MNLQLLDGVPNSIVMFATPLSLDEELNAQIGIYAQDQWKINRLTINMGVRFDYYNASIPAQHQGPGAWVPGRDLTTEPVENVPNWKDWMPRLGAAYDLRGDGRTAIKATVAKYVFGSEIISYTRAANPAGTISDKRDPAMDRHQPRLRAAGERARRRSASVTSATSARRRSGTTPTSTTAGASAATTGRSRR